MNCTALQVALHNAGTPGTSVTPTGRAQSDFESKNVSAHPKIFSVAHVSAKHTREVLCQSSHHQRKSLAEMRKSSERFCQIQDNSHSGQKNSATLYLAATVHYYVRQAISKQGQHERPGKGVLCKTDGTKEVHKWQKI